MPVETTIVLPQPSSTSAPAFTRIQDASGNALQTISPIQGDSYSAPGNFMTVMNVPFVLNGASFDRSRSASAANLIALSGLGAALVAPPGMWSVNHAPIGNVQATASRSAGGAGVRHVCWSSRGSLAAGSVAPGASAIDFNTRDGASGAGAILGDDLAAITASAGAQSPLLGLPSPANIPGTAATAMTAEFNAAGGVNTTERAQITGYDAS